MPDTIAPDAALRHALLDSRQRWRDLVLTAGDFAYETDAWARFVFVMPDPALGWPAATLIGQPAELLLAGGTGANGFNPFRRYRSYFFSKSENFRLGSAATHILTHNSECLAARF